MNVWAKIKKCLKNFFFITSSIFIILILIFVPVIVDIVYDILIATGYFEIEFSKSDILNYYAQFLSLLATVLLGIIAIVQTHRNQRKSEEINELQLRLAKRELEVVEKQYKEDIRAAKMLVPKFEIKIKSYNGCYSNIELEIKNISETIISSFNFISFSVYKGEDEHSVKKWKIDFRSIESAETKLIKVSTPDMCDDEKKTNSKSPWKNIKLIWKFSCDDNKGNTHFYSACTTILNTSEFSKDYWEVEKIG